MKKIYIIPLLSAGLLMAGCSKENQFEGDVDAEGQVLKSALDMSTPSDQIMVTRAESGVDLNNFKINFIKEGNSIADKTYMYSEMPDVVTLKAGNWTATAELGEDRIAEWENPYFKGQSSVFEVKPLEITSFIDPIECQLLNIKATIAFDAGLSAAMSADSYVEVKVGDNQGLNFTATEAGTGKAGYFKHTNENTLVATFRGTINGSKIVESKTYSNIAKGNWYKLTFKLHENNGGDPTGDADGSITVDASVTTENVNANIEIASDEPLDDSERPDWGSGEKPDDPTPPGPVVEGPVFDPVSEGLVFDEIMRVTSDSTVEFKVTSSADAGITVFTCDIKSPFLNDEILGVAGLTTHLDLCDLNEEQVGLLSQFGFPCNVGGQKEVTFTMTPMVMGMLNQGNDDVHEFKVTVSDANGTTVKTLKLQFIQ